MRKLIDYVTNKLNIAKGRTGNKGVSLVEILVAVVIFSMAVAPVMSAFIVSGNMSSKASIRQRATNAAQQIMENFKAYPLEVVASKFSGSTDFLDNNTGSYSTTASAAGYYMGDYSITGFTFSNGDYVSANKDLAEYDARITVTEGAAQPGTTFVTSSSEADLANLSFMDMSKDAFYEAELADNIFTDGISAEIDASISGAYTDILNEAKADFASRTFKTDISEEDIYITGVSISSVKREMKLDLSGKTLVFKYSYSGSFSGYVTSKNYFGKNVVHSFSKGISGDAEVNPSLSVPASSIRNVYYFYYPLYDAGMNYSLGYNVINADGLAVNENGVITNDFDFKSHTIGFKNVNVLSSISITDELQVTGSCTNLFVYKQMNSLVSSLAVAESAYNLKGSASSGIHLFTNLHDDLSKTRDTINSDFADGLGVTDSQYDSNGVFIGDMTGNTEKTQMIYTIKVEVLKHKENAADPDEVLATIEGTRVEKIVKETAAPGAP